MTAALEAFQQRVVDEKKDLDEKISKLKAFFDTKVFNDLPLEDQSLLYRQYNVMRPYQQVLAERIAKF